MKKCILLFMAVLSLFCLCSCTPDNGPVTSDPEYDIISDDEAHYLVFKIDEIEVAKILVVETDTYESLLPYFPTIPEKEGKESYWETIEIYSEDQKVIYINAYYYVTD